MMCAERVQGGAVACGLQCRHKCGVWCVCRVAAGVQKHYNLQPCVVCVSVVAMQYVMHSAPALVWLGESPFFRADARATLSSFIIA